MKTEVILDFYFCFSSTFLNFHLIIHVTVFGTIKHRVNDELLWNSQRISSDMHVNAKESIRIPVNGATTKKS